MNKLLKDAIKNFIADKAILLTATGKGKITKDFSSIEELNSNCRKIYVRRIKCLFRRITC